MEFLKNLLGNMGQFYFLVAVIILAALGAPWLILRRKIVKPEMRLIFSSLIFSIAFTPGIFGGDKGAFTAPVAYLLFYYNDPLWIFIGIVSIILLSLAIFAVRDVLRKKKSNSTP